MTSGDSQYYNDIYIYQSKVAVQIRLDLFNT